MKKVISFSLWGKIRLYCIGAIKNALLAKKFFPEWTCRYYYDTSVPEKVVSYLESLDNTELVFVKTPCGGKKFKDNQQFGALWRFYCIEDDSIEVWMSRDTDSRLSQYERDTIDDFLESDIVLHTFKSKTEKQNLRAGMTSFKNNHRGRNTRKIRSTVAGPSPPTGLFGWKRGPRIRSVREYNVGTIVRKAIDGIKRTHCPFYTDEYILNNKLFPYYRDQYYWTPRQWKDKQLDCVGEYVGQVVDEDDKPINKYHERSFNNRCCYDDLDTLVEEYKKKYDL